MKNKEKELLIQIMSNIDDIKFLLTEKEKSALKRSLQKIDELYEELLSDKKIDPNEISPCPKCLCLTHTLRDSICGKCKREKK